MWCSEWSDFIKSMFTWKYRSFRKRILIRNSLQVTEVIICSLVFHGKALPLILEIAQEFFFSTTLLCRVPAGFHQKLVILSGPCMLQYNNNNNYYYYYYYDDHDDGRYNGPTCFWNNLKSPKISCYLYPWSQTLQPCSCTCEISLGNKVKWSLIC